MTYALHAISLPTDGFPGAKVFFGKGTASREAVLSRLGPEHAGAEITIGEAIDSKAALNMRLLILTEQLRLEYPRIENGWYPMQPHRVTLYLHAAMRSVAHAPAFKSSAEGVAEFRAAMGFDLAMMAAVLSTETTRVFRLEAGKAKFTYDDFRRLRYWAARMGALAELTTAFPLSPLNEQETISE